MKNSRKNKLFHCFRPIYSNPDEIDCSNEHVLFSSSVPRMITDSSLMEKKPSFRRSLSGVFKSAFLHTSTSKKVRESKERTNSHQPSRKSSMERDEVTATGNHKVKAENEAAERLKSRREGLSMNHVVYLALVSLCLLVFCGMSSAVVMTTIWTFCVPVFGQCGSLKDGTIQGFLKENLCRFGRFTVC